MRHFQQITMFGDILRAVETRYWPRRQIAKLLIMRIALIHFTRGADVSAWNVPRLHYFHFQSLNYTDTYGYTERLRYQNSIYLIVIKIY